MRQDVTAETLTTTLINTDKWNVNPDNSLPIGQILSVVPRLLTDKVSLKYNLSGLKRFLTDKFPYFTDKRVTDMFPFYTDKRVTDKFPLYTDKFLFFTDKFPHAPEVFP